MFLNSKRARKRNVVDAARRLMLQPGKGMVICMKTRSRAAKHTESFITFTNQMPRMAQECKQLYKLWNTRLIYSHGKSGN